MKVAGGNFLVCISLITHRTRDDININTIKSHMVHTGASVIHNFLFVTSSLFKTSWQLVLSVFSQADLQELETHTSFTSNVVAILYLIFLVLSVIMLINMLVALLNHTYDNVKVG